MGFVRHLKMAVKEGKGWLLFNALGIGAYLAIGYWISLRCEEEELNGIDQIYLWETQEFSLLALFLGINVTWLLMSRETPFFSKRQLSIWVMSCLIWGIVIACDPIPVKIIGLVIAMIDGSAWNHDSSAPSDGAH